MESSLGKQEFSLRLLFLNQSQILDNQVLTDVNFVLSPIFYNEKSRCHFGRCHSFTPLLVFQSIQYKVAQGHWICTLSWAVSSIVQLAEWVSTRLQLSVGLCAITPHAPYGHQLTWSLRMALSCTELTCPGKTILNYLANIRSPAGKLRTTVCIFLAQNPGRRTPCPIFILLKWCPSGCNEDGGIRSLIFLASCLTHKVHFHTDTEFGKFKNLCILL